MRDALDFLEPHIRSTCLVPQYRHALDRHDDRGYEREGQQQVLRATFPDIRDSVKELLGKKMDALARKFAATHDMKVKAEIDRLSSELVLVKLDRPWAGVRGEMRTRAVIPQEEPCIL